MLQVVVKGLGIDRGKLEGFPVVNKVLIFIIEIMDMLRGVRDVALSYGFPRLSYQGINALWGGSVAWGLGGGASGFVRR